MTSRKTLAERFAIDSKARSDQYEKDKEYLKQFESDVIDYEFTLSEIKFHGIKLSAEWRYLGIGKLLYVCLDALERDRNSPYYRQDERITFKVPVSEIPRLIENLNKFYLVATQSDSEV